ncbi:sigma 54-interacting transcriptional regulator [Methylomonas sp. MgM2]
MDQLVNIQTQPVDFVSFWNQFEADLLYNALRQLSSDIRRLHRTKWLDGNIINKSPLTVVTFPSEEKFVKDITEKIIKIKSLENYLIIFNDEQEILKQPVLANCQEICRWPCTPNELKLRLLRLSKNLDDKCGSSSLTRDISSENWVNFNLVGKSSNFRSVTLMIEQAARCDATVFIEGETGTGKEMSARAIHYQSDRKDCPFMPVNCGAIPDNLLENELFGHEKGAYTDAKEFQLGLINQADGGTLFLDEIEALSPKGQVTLLRFLEEGKIKPLGSKQFIDVNVRIIAASNVKLEKLVEEQGFRIDLMYRLNLLQIALPPLRERSTDIEILATFFMQKFCNQYNFPHKSLSVETLDWMMRHSWPGNVRELENFIHRQFLLNNESQVILKENSCEIKDRRLKYDRRINFDSYYSFSDAKTKVVERFERHYLIELMIKTRGNVSKAARIARKERRALGRLLAKNGIKPENFRYDVI